MFFCYLFFFSIVLPIVLSIFSPSSIRSVILLMLTFSLARPFSFNFHFYCISVVYHHKHFFCLLYLASCRFCETSALSFKHSNRVTINVARGFHCFHPFRGCVATMIRLMCGYFLVAFVSSFSVFFAKLAA